MRKPVPHDQNLTIKKLPPHHILCNPLLTIDFSEQGEEFKRVSLAVNELIESNSDAMIEIVPGVDVRCRS